MRHVLISAPSLGATKPLRPRFALALVAGWAMAGCGGDDGLEARHPVTGTIAYKGDPIAAGIVNFVPVGAEGRPASGVISGGTYKMTTLTPGDGVMAGSYQVAVFPDDVDMSAMVELEKKGMSREEASYLVQRKAAKARKVPAKYSRPDTSGLTAEVKPESNKIDFDLTD